VTAKSQLGNDHIHMPDPFAHLNLAATARAAPEATSSTPVMGEDYRAVQLAAITQASPLQTRRSFDPGQDDEDRALVESLRAEGQRLPVLLVEIDGTCPVEYRVIDGHRRVESLRSLGEQTVKAVIQRVGTLACDLTTLMANVRKNLTPIEQAQAIVRLRERHRLTWESIAQKTGLTARYLRELRALLDADPSVQTALEQGAITVKTAMSLRRAPLDQQPAAVALAAAERMNEPQARQLVEALRDDSKSDTCAATEPAAGGQDTQQPVGGVTSRVGRTLLRELYPELNDAVVVRLAEAADQQGLSLGVLKLAGLLALGGDDPEQALRVVEACDRTPISKRLLLLLDVCAFLKARPRDWTPAQTRMLAILLDRLKATLPARPVGELHQES
jgi:ParB family chromosome partitioning protein